MVMPSAAAAVAALWMALNNAGSRRPIAECCTSNGVSVPPFGREPSPGSAGGFNGTL